MAAIDDTYLREDLYVYTAEMHSAAFGLHAIFMKAHTSCLI